MERVQTPDRFHPFVPKPIPIKFYLMEGEGKELRYFVDERPSFTPCLMKKIQTPDRNPRARVPLASLTCLRNDNRKVVEEELGYPAKYLKDNPLMRIELDTLPDWDRWKNLFMKERIAAFEPGQNGVPKVSPCSGGETVLWGTFVSLCI
jgi:hypothetical protein